jgi:glycosyltransferase involved in cell wall biosynthesis
MFKRISLVLWRHGSFDQIHWRHHRLKKDISWHLFLSKAVQKCSSIHYTTIYEQKQSNWRGKFNSFVLNNGFDMSLFYYHLEERSDLRYAMGIPDDDIVAIIVGRPDPKKGVELAIRALVHEVRAWLLFVGDAMDPIVASWKRSRATSVSLIGWYGLGF